MKLDAAAETVEELLTVQFVVSFVIGIFLKGILS